MYSDTIVTPQQMLGLQSNIICRQNVKFPLDKSVSHKVIKSSVSILIIWRILCKNCRHFNKYKFILINKL